MWTVVYFCVWDVRMICIASSMYCTFRMICSASSTYCIFRTHCTFIMICFAVSTHCVFKIICITSSMLWILIMIYFASSMYLLLVWVRLLTNIYKCNSLQVDNYCLCLHYYSIDMGYGPNVYIYVVFVCSWCVPKRSTPLCIQNTLFFEV